jgi:murein DD-endopeptidase MepM/ murein hydrolase activator NlpD
MRFTASVRIHSMTGKFTWLAGKRMMILLSIVFLFPLIHAADTPVARAYSDTDARPAFLEWPLPHYIGLPRISQFPNSPWTWNYLGLNPGQQCPPAFGYLLNVDSWRYWRDPSVPLEQDQAWADPHNFEMVACYSTDFDMGENGHEGTDIKAPAGTPVYASADGRVQEWRQGGLNSMIVLKHCLDGGWEDGGGCNRTQWYTTYMHIIPTVDLLEENKAVRAGEQIGVIYDQTINSHLHFEVGLEKRSYRNFVNPWGRDTTPWIGCMWRDQRLCIQADPAYERQAILTGAGRLLVRQGHAGLTEIFGVPQISRIQISTQRIAILDQAGNLSAKDGAYPRALPVGHDFYINWTMLGSNVKDFRMTDTRLAVLGRDGRLRIKEGGLHQGWALELDGVQAVSISDQRVGILTGSGEVMVLEGALNAPWVMVAEGVIAFQIIDSRIAVLDALGTLRAQEGSLDQEWREMAQGVTAFQVTPVRVAFLDGENVLWVNHGNLRADFVRQAGDVRSFQLASDRILIRTEDGGWKIRLGDLFQPWRELMGFPVLTVMLENHAPVSLNP